VLFAVRSSKDDDCLQGKKCLNPYKTAELCVCPGSSEVIVIGSYSFKCYRRRGEYSTGAPGRGSSWQLI